MRIIDIIKRRPYLIFVILALVAIILYFITYLSLSNYPFDNLTAKEAFEYAEHELKKWDYQSDLLSIIPIGSCYNGRAEYGWIFEFINSNRTNILKIDVGPTNKIETNVRSASYCPPIIKNWLIDSDDIFNIITESEEYNFLLNYTYGYPPFSQFSLIGNNQGNPYWKTHWTYYDDDLNENQIEISIDATTGEFL